MRINAIAATNFKGRTFSTDLSPITILVGDNFAGKSSRSEAITLAMAGYLPGIEKRPSNIHERLSSDDRMTVSLAFDNGAAVTRDYVRDAKGAVKCTVTQRGLSAQWAVDPVLVDPLEFLGLSSKERIKYLFSKIEITGEVVTPASLFLPMNAMAQAKTEEGAEYLAQLEMSVTDDHEKCVTAGLSPQAWLEALIIKFNDCRKSTLQRQKVLATVDNETAGDTMTFNRKAVEEAFTVADRAAAEALKALNAAEVAAKTASVTITDNDERTALRVAEVDYISRSKKVAALGQDLESIGKLECCSMCGAKNKGWRKKIEDKAKAEFDEMVKSCDAAFAKFNAATVALKDKQDTIADLTSKAGKELNAAWQAAQVTYQAACDKLHQARFDLEQMRRADEKIAEGAKLRKERVTTSIRHEILDAFCKLAQESLDAMVTNSITPFLNRVNELCAGILPYPVAYKEGELGMARKDGFTTWKSFSGSERLLFMCGVSLAMAVGGQLRVAFLDEVGRLDAKNKAKLFARVKQLQSDDRLDQAILIEASNAEAWRKIAALDGAVSIVEIK